MKYAVLLCDGMADTPREDLGGTTPMGKANKPNMDRIAKVSEVGMVKTVGEGLKPGSDVANLSVLGYDPAVYYTGRSPLEAGSIGIDMKSTDVSLRCNLVTVSDEADYSKKTMIDYCADDISTAEAAELIKYVEENFGNEEFKFYSGVSYRHCLIWNNGTLDLGNMTPPHDITGRVVTEYLSTSPNAEKLLDLMKRSYDLLKDHPVNKAREARGKRPANSIWLWGEGKRAELTPFKEKYGVSGAMISAVDLLKGIGKFAEMNVIEVEGATGYIDTNFKGKAEAAIKALKDGADFVYVHMEAPDECGHRAEVENKVKSIEIIDEQVLGPMLEAFKDEDIRILICPDHPTPLELKTHTSNPVPYLIYDSTKEVKGVEKFDEAHAEASGIFRSVGHELINVFLQK
ncbi:MAG: cofactor-independent phosphoglycerate mutase [Oscillospiraceae bacterium]|nr:cofactor-independent phosphoglycerate mutase [Oscillospiraceae bacterium]